VISTRLFFIRRSIYGHTKNVNTDAATEMYKYSGSAAQNIGRSPSTNL